MVRQQGLIARDPVGDDHDRRRQHLELRTEPNVRPRIHEPIGTAARSDPLYELKLHRLPRINPVQVRHLQRRRRELGISVGRNAVVATEDHTPRPGCGLGPAAATEPPDQQVVPGDRVARKLSITQRPVQLEARFAHSLCENRVLDRERRRRLPQVMHTS